jgi:hypothetical protein
MTPEVTSGTLEFELFTHVSGWDFIAAAVGLAGVVFGVAEILTGDTRDGRYILAVGLIAFTVNSVSIAWALRKRRR